MGAIITHFKGGDCNGLFRIADYFDACDWELTIGAILLRPEPRSSVAGDLK